MFLGFFCKRKEPSVTKRILYTNSRQKWQEVHTYARKMKKCWVVSLDQLYPVITGFAQADLGGQNKFQTKMGNCHGEFFLTKQRGM